jgi:hypothetical protein
MSQSLDSWCGLPVINFRLHPLRNDHKSNLKCSPWTRWAFTCRGLLKIYEGNTPLTRWYLLLATLETITKWVKKGWPVTKVENSNNHNNRKHVCSHYQYKWVFYQYVYQYVSDFNSTPPTSKQDFLSFSLLLSVVFISSNFSVQPYIPSVSRKNILEIKIQNWSIPNQLSQMD